MNRYELEKKLRTGSRSRDFQWYKRLYAQGRLFIRDTPMTEQVFEHFRLTVKTTEEIYPGDWDVEFEICSSGIANNKIRIRIKGIIVRFPEVTIRNSQRKSHTIKDLFIRTSFQIISNSLKIEGVYGTRTTLTYAEHNSRYLHSHLQRLRLDPGNKYFYFIRFCTGSGSINIAIADINSQGFSAARYISYLLNLDTLASWESLEGVPYVKIGDINAIREGAREYNSSGNNASQFITAFKRGLTTPFSGVVDINFKLEPYGVSIMNDDKYDTFLNSVRLENHEKGYLLCFKSEDGVYCSYGQTLQAIVVPSFPNKYLFQGEEIEVTITNAPEDLPTEVEYVYHPKTKLEIKKLLEYAANKAILRKITVDRYKDSTSDIRENPKPDPIPVPTDSESGMVGDIVL